MASCMQSSSQVYNSWIVHEGKSTSAHEKHFRSQQEAFLEFPRDILKPSSQQAVEDVQKVLAQASQRVQTEFRVLFESTHEFKCATMANGLSGHNCQVQS